MSENFIIPLNGLATGKNEFFWKVGKEFFQGFDNAEMLDAELDAEVIVEKSGRYVGVDCQVWGDVVVECDRCLDEVRMPIDVEIKLSVKYGEEEPSEEYHEGEREIVFVSETEAEFDMSQIIYDYVCLALPMQRTHEEGECNPAAMKYYGVSDEPRSSDDNDAENPFAALKGLF